MFGALLKTVKDVAILPVAAVCDLATMGGDQEKTRTERKLEQIGDDLTELGDELFD